MKTKILLTGAFLCAALISTGAYAQGTLRGAEEGAAAGGNAGGPIGAIVGGAIGAATGTVGGILGVEDRPRFREYAVREGRPSYRSREDLRVGAVMPQEGVTYYEAPPEYGVRDYRYTVVNGRTVLVEPRTHRIVEIVE